MLELARFPDPRMGRVFLALLQQQRIDAVLHIEDDQGVIFLREPEHFDKARALLREFLANPSHPRFQAAAWATGEPAAPSEGGEDQVPFFSRVWLAGIGPVTRTLAVAMVVVFLTVPFVEMRLYEALMFPESLDGLLRQPWRLFTPMLLHFGLLHIAFNMIWWIELGRTIERFHSSRQLLFLTLATGALSALAQFFATDHRFGGMSGVVFGLLGYLWIYGQVHPRSGLILRREIVVLMLGWLVFCYVFLDDFVANEAHLGGLVSGALFGALTGLHHRDRPRSGPS